LHEVEKFLRDAARDVVRDKMAVAAVAVEDTEEPV
jgi:hypothetical protein